MVVELTRVCPTNVFDVVKTCTRYNVDFVDAVSCCVYTVPMLSKCHFCVSRRQGHGKRQRIVGGKVTADNNAAAVGKSTVCDMVM